MDNDALFHPEPHRWGLRGDPHVWRSMRDIVTTAPPAASADELVRLLHDTFEHIVGVRLEEGGDDRVFLSEFDTGGMSGGWVDLGAWRRSLMPLLEQRATDAGERD